MSHAYRASYRETRIKKEGGKRKKKKNIFCLLKEYAGPVLVLIARDQGKEEGEEGKGKKKVAGDSLHLYSDCDPGQPRQCREQLKGEGREGGEGEGRGKKRSFFSSLSINPILFLLSICISSIVREGVGKRGEEKKGREKKGRGRGESSFLFLPPLHCTSGV